jgi:periplasmic protein CpxP/Spy
MGKLKRIHAIALAAVMAVAIAVPFAIAQSKDAGEHKGRRAEGREGMRGGDRRGGGRMGAAFRNLDLTEAQKTQMKQIRESRGQNLRPLMEQIRTKRQEIRQARQGGTFDESLVAQKLSEIAPLEAKLMGERARTHQEMLSVLTAEQKAKLDQSRDQRKSKWSERRANKQTAK